MGPSVPTSQLPPCQGRGSGGRARGTISFSLMGAQSTLSAPRAPGHLAAGLHSVTCLEATTSSLIREAPQAMGPTGLLLRALLRGSPLHPGFRPSHPGSTPLASHPVWPPQNLAPQPLTWAPASVPLGLAPRTSVRWSAPGYCLGGENTGGFQPRKPPSQWPECLAGLRGWWVTSLSWI